MSDDRRQIKNWCGEHSKDCAVGKIDSCSHADEKVEPSGRRAAAGVVATTAPRSGSSATDFSGRASRGSWNALSPRHAPEGRKCWRTNAFLDEKSEKGGLCFVRLCRSKVNGEKFACKILPMSSEETVHREVEILQHISGHPGILTTKAVFEDCELIHLVMEFCSGGWIIDQISKERSYSEQRAVTLIKELISVVKYCHEMGVVHRDIKPENILLTTSPRLKLAGFGLAAGVTTGQKLSSIAQT